MSLRQPANLRFQESIREASLNTPYPGNEQAGFAEVFDDPRVVNSPYLAPQRDPRFHENLAFYISESELRRIGQQLTDGVKADDDDRQKSLRITKQAIDYMGIGQDRATIGPTISKASEIYGPTFLRLAVQNTAKLHGNLFPAKNLVDCEIFGQTTEEVEDQAERMKDFTNYMLSEVMNGYSEDKKQALFWMTISGQVFSKVCIDESRNVPTAAYVRSEDIIINSGASSVMDAERVTHRFPLSERIVKHKMRNREWKEVHLEEYDIDQDIVRKKIDNKLGHEGQQTEYNKFHSLDETICWLDIPGFEHIDNRGRPTGTRLPYVVTKDTYSNNIVKIVRNYNELDPLYRSIQRLTQYKYFTGQGPYGFGLAHMILGLAKTETQILQQLILAGEFSNTPALIQKSTGKNEKSQLNFTPGSVTQISCFEGASIADAFMNVPFKEPSATLLDLLRNTITPAMEDLSGAVNFSPDSMPANATATLISAVVSTSHILEDSIMRGLYDSFAAELRLLFNLFAQWLPYSPYPFQVAGGQKHIVREDFAPNLQIKPTIDPNASSSMQQSVLAEAMMSVAAQNPELYDMREVHKFTLKALKVSNIDALLLPKPEEAPPPPAMDFVSENAAAVRGEPIKVYQSQDHDAHELGHNDMIVRLTNDENVDNSDKIAALQAHNSDHKAFKYVAQMQAMMGKQMPQDVTELPPDVQNQISVLAAKALQKQQDKDAKTNPPPLDPNVVMMKEQEVKQEANHLKHEIDQQELQLEHEQLQDEKQQGDMDNQIRIQETKYKHEQLELEKIKLQMQQQEIELKSQERMAELELQKQKMLLDTQAKSYDSTLKYEVNKQNEAIRSEQDKYKADLDAQSKAYDSTLAYEQKSKEEDVSEKSEPSKK